jgi:hypothetical protein
VEAAYAYANGRRWTEAEVLQLEAEVVALRRSILEHPPAAAAGATTLSESARIDQILTSRLGPRDPSFEQSQSRQLRRPAPQSGGGRVGLSPEWLAASQMNSGSGGQTQAAKNAAAKQLAAVRAEIAQLRSELGEGMLT